MMNALNTLTIGKLYQIKDSPFKQVKQNFTGYFGGVTDETAEFFIPTNNPSNRSERVRFSEWDLNQAMDLGEITIIELS